MGQTLFESLKGYVEFDDRSSATLRELHPRALPHLPEIVDDFYGAIAAHPGASAAITGGAAQIERLKGTLTRWVETLLLGPHDEAYFELRSRIGRVHVRIALPQAYMFTAMDRIRVRLLTIARDAYAHDPAAADRTTRALHQILDLELAIMLETYREDLVARIKTIERLATIGELASSIGHELRNPLATIESSLFLLRQRLAQAGLDDARATKHVERIAAQVQLSNKTITDLLALARDRAPQRRPLLVAEVVARALSDTPLPPGVVVATEIPVALSVEGDPDQLAQVVSNLLMNAAQALGERGRIQVSGGRGEGRVTLRVHDEGPGVSAEIAHRIFEPLFTTRAKGIGLGLPLCRRIVEAHGGVLELEPSAAGACFRVTLPDVPDAVREALAERARGYEGGFR